MNKIFKLAKIEAEWMRYYGHVDSRLEEKFEDIEILRMIENNIPVKMINLSKDSFSIDLKEDFHKLQKLKNFSNSYN